MLAQSRIGHHLGSNTFLPLLIMVTHCITVFSFSVSLMDREVALLAEMDKVKAEASEYTFFPKKIFLFSSLSLSISTDALKRKYLTKTETLSSVVGN